MIVCKACGERQADGTVFCGRCGAFLEWEGEPVRPPEESVPELTDSGSTSDTTVPARQPAATRQRSAGPAPATLDPLPSGSLVCGKCGVGNEPQRRFCRSCGESLADATVVGRPPWWRRMFRGEKTYAAGTRRRPKNRIGRSLRWGGLAILVAAVVVVAGPLRPHIVHAFHKVKAEATAPIRHVHPDGFTANVAVSGHAAALAADGASNTYWGAPRHAVHPYLRAVFTKPIDLVEVGVTGGVSTRGPAFLASARPRTVTLIARTTSGEKQHRYTLDDTAGFQKLRFIVTNVKVLRVVVTSSTGSTKRISTAVTEVEFFARG